MSNGLKAGELFILKDDSGAIIAADEESWSRLNKIKKGVKYKVKFSRFRNYEFHKMFFAMLNLAFNNQEQFRDFKWFRDDVIIGIGHCETYVYPDGRVLFRPDSLSFAKCNQDEFNEIHQKALTYLMHKYGYDDSFVMQLRSFI